MKTQTSANWRCWQSADDGLLPFVESYVSIRRKWKYFILKKTGPGVRNGDEKIAEEAGRKQSSDLFHYLIPLNETEG